MDHLYKSHKPVCASPDMRCNFTNIAAGSIILCIKCCADNRWVLHSAICARNLMTTYLSKFYMLRSIKLLSTVRRRYTRQRAEQSERAESLRHRQGNVLPHPSIRLSNPSMPTRKQSSPRSSYIVYSNLCRSRCSTSQSRGSEPFCRIKRP